MRLQLDPDSPVPLYHQIAEAIRYRIATGQLPPGSQLPTLREAAREWDVNLHTVRHAYKTLADQGYLTIRPPLGAVVADRTHRARAEALEEFLDKTLAEARDTHGLAAWQLLEHLAARSAESEVEQPAVYVVECSQTQSEELAAQIAARWRVRAVPWSLASNDGLPDGSTVATYFHYNDIRLVAPSRLSQIRFVTIRPDSSLTGQVQNQIGSRRKPTVLLVERDESMARSIAADVSVLLGPVGVAAEPVVVPEARDALESYPRAHVLLFSPRMWGALTPEERRDRRALEVRYVIDRDELAALGRDAGWSPSEVRSKVGAVAR